MWMYYHPWSNFRLTDLGRQQRNGETITMVMVAHILSRDCVIMAMGAHVLRRDCVIMAMGAHVLRRDCVIMAMEHTY